MILIFFLDALIKLRSYLDGVNTEHEHNYYCRNIGVSEQWGVGILGCRNIGVSEQWGVGILGVGI